MKRKSPVAEAIEAKVAVKYRSPVEGRVAEQLAAAGLKCTYEGERVPVTIPAREAYYLPDFPRVNGSNIVIEVKGNFGGVQGKFGGGDFKKRSADARQKLLLVKEQHPELDIRLVFERASTKIYPKSPTTNAKWAEDHGFKWADKGTIPPAWIIEMQQQQQKGRKKK